MDALPTTEQFRDHALGYWSKIAAGNSRQANAETAALDAVVDSWHTAGVARERLATLLDDVSREVRYAAAAYLGATEPRAVAELRRLAEDPTGLVAPTAGLLLRTWRK